MRSTNRKSWVSRQSVADHADSALGLHHRLTVTACAVAACTVALSALLVAAVTWPDKVRAQGRKDNDSVFGMREETLGERARRARRNASRQQGYQAHRARPARHMGLPRHYTRQRRLGWVAAVPPRGVRRVHDRVVYYYYRGRYYWPSENGYSMFTSPPAGGLRQVEDLGAWPDMPELKVIAPGNFSESEHINARAQCHYIATDRTGFDPTLSGGGVSADQYKRLKERYLDSITQCLTDRGYVRG